MHYAYCIRIQNMQLLFDCYVLAVEARIQNAAMQTKQRYCARFAACSVHRRKRKIPPPSPPPRPQTNHRSLARSWCRRPTPNRSRSRSSSPPQTSCASRPRASAWQSQVRRGGRERGRGGAAIRTRGAIRLVVAAVQRQAVVGAVAALRRTAALQLRA